MGVDIGIVGAGNRGRTHAEEYANIEHANVVAVADVDADSANSLATEYDVGEVYTDYRDLLDETKPDAVSVCIHNNLHTPITIDAVEAGAHVFCEKPIAGSYADAKRMVDAATAANRTLAVQNGRLFSPETRAARRLVAHDELGETYYGRAVYARRRGRPYVDGYGTPAFVSKSEAGGGAVFDVGTYEIGRVLSLLGNPCVERVAGQTFEFTEDTYDEALVEDNRDVYRQRLDVANYDVEDTGVGVAHLADGSVLAVDVSWHAYLPDDSSAIVGSQGGVAFDPFEFKTTLADYETTVSLDIDDFEARQGLLRGDGGYAFDDFPGQYEHWIQTIRGVADNPIPTDEIALNSMRVMEGIYLSAEAGQELDRTAIADRSRSSAIDPN